MEAIGLALMGTGFLLMPTEPLFIGRMLGKTAANAAPKRDEADYTYEPPAWSRKRY